MISPSAANWWAVELGLLRKKLDDLLRRAGREDCGFFRSHVATMQILLSEFEVRLSKEPIERISPEDELQGVNKGKA